MKATSGGGEQAIPNERERRIIEAWNATLSEVTATGPETSPVPGPALVVVVRHGARPHSYVQARGGGVADSVLCCRGRLGANLVCL